VRRSAIKLVAVLPFFFKQIVSNKTTSALLAKGCVLEKPRDGPHGQVVVFSDSFGKLWDLIEASLPLVAKKNTLSIDVYVIPSISKRLKYLTFNFSVDFSREASHELKGFGHAIISHKSYVPTLM
jgi:hypothetical protein